MRYLIAVAVLAMTVTLSLATPAGASYTLSGSATSYHKCDGSSGATADESGVYWGEVASNDLRMGTWIQAVHPHKINGRRFFQVHDTGGPGFLIDIYAPYCSWANAWGRQNVTIRVLTRRDLWHGKPKAGFIKRYPWERPIWKP